MQRGLVGSEMCIRDRHMIVDIQGVYKDGQLCIIDPTIHAALKRDHYGKGNHGVLGMIRFFNTHNCDRPCSHLLLSSPSNKKKMFESGSVTDQESAELNAAYENAITTEYTESINRIKNFGEAEVSQKNPSHIFFKRKNKDFICGIISP
eukprot:TRINITY_DN17662_c0_g1_i3.p2 TRINITY_DN17662_c0_g1~~TRINITY_DN17662_c0_g1_i3.p2  ORF type:complete len:149 (-),score=35.49 TRINITY_DN17662_c0_g1_i3:235-681(-)